MASGGLEGHPHALRSTSRQIPSLDGTPPDASYLLQQQAFKAIYIAFTTRQYVAGGLGLIEAEGLERNGDCSMQLRSFPEAPWLTQPLLRAGAGINLASILPLIFL